MKRKKEKNVWVVINKDIVTSKHTVIQILDLNGKLIKKEKH